MANVGAPSQAVLDMHAQQMVIRDLLGGTAEMRKAAQRYMPQWPLEDDEAYQARLNTATLYPALSETLASMVGRVFFREFTKRDIPDSIDVNDIDAMGNKLEIFCAEWFKDALAYGVSYCVVDFQRGGAQTLADVQAQGSRAQAVHIPAANVIGWKSEKIGGAEVCSQFRYREFVHIDDDDFSEQWAEQVVVLERGLRRVFRRSNNDYVQVDEAVLAAGGAPLQVVPVVALYTERRGFFAGKPPLLELAHLNVKHWQSQSDQDNILHFARVPLLARFGVDDGQDVRIGNSTIDIPLGGDIRYVEHSGAAIAAGERALEKLEQDMQTAGAKLLMKSANSFTDSQAKDEQTREVSALKMYANRLEDAIGQMLYLFALWYGKDHGGTVEISGNLDIDYNPATTMQMLRDLHADGIISAKTVFTEAQKRELISADLDFEAEQAQTDGMNREFSE